MRIMKTHNEYIQQLKNKQIKIIPIEPYGGQKKKIKHRCLQCKYEWDVKPGQLLHPNGGCGCPICSHRIIGPAPNYINSIWASEYKNYCAQYLTETQMKLYMPHSQKCIEVICPDCGNKKIIKVADMIYRGFNCMCQDGQSFPNKLVFNVLTQLGLNIKPEYTPKWANGKRYDDYLIDYNIIIENHGLQHYKEIPWLSMNKTFEDIIQCDRCKYKVAMDHGIKQYIILDCRVSSLDWIKKSIMESKLPNILNFTEDDIDWTYALEYASSNTIKEAADMFNDGDTVATIALKLNKNQCTIRRWLKRARIIGWCN